MQSPQYSNSGRVDLFGKQRSPSFRKRIPSTQEHYLCHSNQNLRSSKQDSPSKCNEEIKRRKSQLGEQNALTSSSSKKKSKNISNSSANNNPHFSQDIINSIQLLKEEYHTLREAYKTLIQEKVKHQEEIATAHTHNSQLKQTVDQLTSNEHILIAENQTIKQQLLKTEQELTYTRQLLDQERKKMKILQNDVYFMNEREKSKTDYLVFNSNSQPIDFETIFHQNLKEHKIQDQTPLEPTIQQISPTTPNEAHLLSFSLTSLIDQSMRPEPLSRRMKQHVKVVSDLSQMGSGLNNLEFGNIQLKSKKETSGIFKKHKKQNKPQSAIDCKILSSPLNQLLNLKSPVSNDKKNLKNLGISNTKRRKVQDKQNFELPKNQKKKSKKILQIGTTE